MPERNGGYWSAQGYEGYAGTWVRLGSIGRRGRRNCDGNGNSVSRITKALERRNDTD